MTQPPINPSAGSPQPQEAQPGLHPHVFEFSPIQNDVIRTLSKRMHFVGVFYVVASGLVALAGLVAFFFYPLLGAFYFLILLPELLVGIWTIHAANSFRQVADTKGYDIPHLMAALASLRKLYTLMFWLLVAALAFMVLGIAAGIFFWMTGMLSVPTAGSAYTLLAL